MAAATEALFVTVASALPSSSPPPSPLTSLSSPLLQVYSPPLPLPSPPLPLPAPSLPLLLPTADCREDVFEADVPPQKRLCLTAPTPRFKVGESSTTASARQPIMDVTHAINYGFVDTMNATPGRHMTREVGYKITNVWDDMIRDMEEIALTTLEKMTPKRTTTTTTLMTDFAIKSLIAHGIATALAEYEANRGNENGDDSHDSGNGRRTERAAAGPSEKKVYGGSKPSYLKCNYHHEGQCAPRSNQRVTTCFECGVQGHYKRDCPKLKNKNQGNQAGYGNAQARAYDVGTAGTNPNSNVVTGTFLLNNRCASILFDTGAARSFMSTTFSSLLNIIPTTLGHGYAVELADNK
nr:hypothetical protein [Tanacetum cinerariifolium]